MYSKGFSTVFVKLAASLNRKLQKLNMSTEIPYNNSYEKQLKGR